MIDLRNVRFCPKCTKVSPDTCYHENPILMQKYTGIYGKFWGCSNYPKCRYSYSIPKNYIMDYEDELKPY